MNPKLERVLEQAALLQKLIPEAVLVGGSAAAFYAARRYSEDHDHVLADLAERFEVVLEALEADGSYEINRVTPGKIIIGARGGIEYGIRQLIRLRPLEVQMELLPSGNMVRVPTFEETLRVKAFLLVTRNSVRDHLDVSALGVKMGIKEAGRVLSTIDDYYQDQFQKLESGTVASALVGMLFNPQPIDEASSKALSQYKDLDARWHNWNDIKTVLKEISLELG